MRTSSRHLLRDLLRSGTALLIALSVASPAEAQIGSRLKKLGKDAMKDAAKAKVGGSAKDSSAAGSGSGAATGGAGGSNSAKVDIAVTSDRVTMVMAAIASVAERAKLLATANAERAVYEPKRDSAMACVQGATSNGAMPSQAGMQASRKMSARQDGLSRRYNAALAANDRLKAVFLEDSLQVATHELTATMFGVAGKCGARPYAPPSLLRAMAGANESGDDFNTLVVTDPALSAMTRYQFGMVRERIALYAMSQAGLISAKAAGKEGVFTEEELAVLAARRDELVAMAPLFKGGTLTWSGSSDLRGW
ncbi:MAG: hypothetical protein IPP20_09055 [Gemmatimonadetes bacterium]|nr:hypothetical protein [Gemmatimonadota bacterium]